MNNIFTNIFDTVKSILRNGITGTIGAEMGKKQAVDILAKNFTPEELAWLREHVKGSCKRDK